MIKRLLADWTVTVRWEELTAEHKAWTRAEALAWVGCYPTGARIEVRNWFGRLVATRGAA